MTDRHCRTAGFTLIEMSIVMAIMGLILAGAATVMNGRVNAEQKNLSSQRLQAASDGLAAYYVANNRLPCPADGSLASDDANYGRAQPETSGACDTVAVTSGEAVLPWRTLGLREPESLDGWDQRLRYFVSADLTTAGSSLPGTLVLRDGDVSNPTSVELSSDAAYVVLSSGDNGLGGWLRSGAQKTVVGISTDEQLNVDGTSVFIDRRFSSITGDEFDDMIVWQPKLRLTQATGASFTGGVCTAADNVSIAAGCPGGAVDDACTIAEAVLARCL